MATSRRASQAKFNSWLKHVLTSPSLTSLLRKCDTKDPGLAVFYDSSHLYELGLDQLEECVRHLVDGYRRLHHLLQGSSSAVVELVCLLRQSIEENFPSVTLADETLDLNYSPPRRSASGRVITAKKPVSPTVDRVSRSTPSVKEPQQEPLSIRLRTPSSVLHIKRTRQDEKSKEEVVEVPPAKKAAIVTISSTGRSGTRGSQESEEKTSQSQSVPSKLKIRLEGPKTSQDTMDIDSPAFERVTDDNWMEGAKKLVTFLRNDERFEPFHFPVDREEVPDYTDVIKKPADLQTLRSNLSRLKTLDTCLATLRRIWSNCLVYNREGSEFFKLAYRLGLEVEQHIATIFGPEKVSYSWIDHAREESASPLRSLVIPEPPKIVQKGKRTLSNTELSNTPVASSTSKKPAVETKTKQPVVETKESNTKQPKSSHVVEPVISAKDSQKEYAAAVANVTQQSRTLMLQLIDEIMQLPCAEFFIDEVTDRIAPGYSDVISKPMWLKKVRKQIQAGSYSFDKAGQTALMEDMTLIRSNCHEYNEPKSQISLLSNQLLSAFQSRFKYLSTELAELMATIPKLSEPSEPVPSTQPPPVPKVTPKAAPTKKTADRGDDGIVAPDITPFDIEEGAVLPSEVPLVEVSCDVSTFPMASMVRVLKWLRAFPDIEPFLLPVDASAVPGYASVIRHPMDISTVQDRLIAGRYSNNSVVGTAVPTNTGSGNASFTGPAAFAADIRRIWANCFIFNSGGSPMHTTGLSCAHYFEACLRQILPSAPVGRRLLLSDATGNIVLAGAFTVSPSSSAPTSLSTPTAAAATITSLMTGPPINRPKVRAKKGNQNEDHADSAITLLEGEDELKSIIRGSEDDEVIACELRKEYCKYPLELIQRVLVPSKENLTTSILLSLMEALRKYNYAVMLSIIPDAESDAETMASIQAVNALASLEEPYTVWAPLTLARVARHIARGLYLENPFKFVDDVRNVWSQTFLAAKIASAASPPSSGEENGTQVMEAALRCAHFFEAQLESLASGQRSGISVLVSTPSMERCRGYPVVGHPLVVSDSMKKSQKNSDDWIYACLLESSSGERSEIILDITTTSSLDALYQQRQKSYEIICSNLLRHPLISASPFASPIGISAKLPAGTSGSPIVGLDLSTILIQCDQLVYSPLAFLRHLRNCFRAFLKVPENSFFRPAKIGITLAMRLFQVQFPWYCGWIDLDDAQLLRASSQQARVERSAYGIGNDNLSLNDSSASWTPSALEEIKPAFSTSSTTIATPLPGGGTITRRLTSMADKHAYVPTPAKLDSIPHALSAEISAHMEILRTLLCSEKATSSPVCRQFLRSQAALKYSSERLPFREIPGCYEILSCGDASLAIRATKSALFPAGYTVRRLLLLKCPNGTIPFIVHSKIVPTIESTESNLPLNEVISASNKTRDVEFQVTLPSGVILSRGNDPRNTWLSAVDSAAMTALVLTRPLRRCRAVLNRLSVELDAWNLFRRPPVPEGSSGAIHYTSVDNTTYPTTPSLCLYDISKRLDRGVYSDEFDFYLDVESAVMSWRSAGLISTSNGAPQVTREDHNRVHRWWQMFQSLFARWVLPASRPVGEITSLVQSTVMEPTAIPLGGRSVSRKGGRQTGGCFKFEEMRGSWDDWMSIEFYREGSPASPEAIAPPDLCRKCWNRLPVSNSSESFCGRCAVSIFDYTSDTSVGVEFTPTASGYFRGNALVNRSVDQIKNPTIEESTFFVTRCGHVATSTRFLEEILAEERMLFHELILQQQNELIQSPEDSTLLSTFSTLRDAIHDESRRLLWDSFTIFSSLRCSLWERHDFKSKIAPLLSLSPSTTSTDFAWYTAPDREYTSIQEVISSADLISRNTIPVYGYFGQHRTRIRELLEGVVSIDESEACNTYECVVFSKEIREHLISRLDQITTGQRTKRDCLEKVMIRERWQWRRELLNPPSLPPLIAESDSLMSVALERSEDGLRFLLDVGASELVPLKTSRLSMDSVLVAWDALHFLRPIIGPTRITLSELMDAVSSVRCTHPLKKLPASSPLANPENALLLPSVSDATFDHVGILFTDALLSYVRCRTFPTLTESTANFAEYSTSRGYSSYIPTENEISWERLAAQWPVNSLTWPRTMERALLVTSLPLSHQQIVKLLSFYSLQDIRGIALRILSIVWSHPLVEAIIVLQTAGKEDPSIPSLPSSSSVIDSILTLINLAIDSDDQDPSAVAVFVSTDKFKERLMESFTASGENSTLNELDISVVSELKIWVLNCLHRLGITDLGEEEVPQELVFYGEDTYKRLFATVPILPSLLTHPQPNRICGVRTHSSPHIVSHASFSTAVTPTSSFSLRIRHTYSLERSLAVLSGVEVEMWSPEDRIHVLRAVTELSLSSPSVDIILNNIQSLSDKSLESLPHDEQEMYDLPVDFPTLRYLPSTAICPFTGISTIEVPDKKRWTLVPDDFLDLVHYALRLQPSENVPSPCYALTTVMTRLVNCRRLAYSDRLEYMRRGEVWIKQLSSTSPTVLSSSYSHLSPMHHHRGRPLGVDRFGHSYWTFFTQTNTTVCPIDLEGRSLHPTISDFVEPVLFVRTSEGRWLYLSGLIIQRLLQGLVSLPSMVALKDSSMVQNLSEDSVLVDTASSPHLLAAQMREISSRHFQIRYRIAERLCYTRDIYRLTTTPRSVEMPWILRKHALVSTSYQTPQLIVDEESLISSKNKKLSTPAPIVTSITEESKSSPPAHDKDESPAVLESRHLQLEVWSARMMESRMCDYYALFLRDEDETTAVEGEFGEMISPPAPTSLTAIHPALSCVGVANFIARSTSQANTGARTDRETMLRRIRRLREMLPEDTFDHHPTKGYTRTDPLYRIHQLAGQTTATRIHTEDSTAALIHQSLSKSFFVVRSPDPTSTTESVTQQASSNISQSTGDGASKVVQPTIPAPIYNQYNTFPMISNPQTIGNRSYLITSNCTSSARLVRLKTELMNILYTLPEKLLRWSSLPPELEEHIEAMGRDTEEKIRATLGDTPESEAIRHVEKQSRKSRRRLRRKLAVEYLQTAIRSAIWPDQLMRAVVLIEDALPAQYSNIVGKLMLPTFGVTTSDVAHRIFILDRTISYQGIFNIHLARLHSPSVLRTHFVPRCCVTHSCSRVFGHVDRCVPSSPGFTRYPSADEIMMNSMNPIQIGAVTPVLGSATWNSSQPNRRVLPPVSSAPPAPLATKSIQSRPAERIALPPLESFQHQILDVELVNPLVPTNSEVRNVIIL